MNDYYLKFESEAQADAALVESDLAGMAVDIVGVLYESTGETVERDGLPVPVMAPLPGWHVNLRGMALPAGLESFAVTPETPSRVWA